MLTEQMKNGILNYKYSCADTSPLAIHVMHPFWNWLVQFYPMWWAPNAITLVGFIMTVMHFGLLSYYNPQFDQEYQVPSVIWFFCGFLVFVAHMLDGTDGKQARRLQASSPLGELFDHGCDSWAAYLIPAVIISMIGSVLTPWRLFAIIWTIIISFFASHYEKYITGFLFLPWSYDFSQLSVAACCFIASVFTPAIFHKPIIFKISAVLLFEIVMYVSFVIQVIHTARTLMLNKSNKDWPDSWQCLAYWTAPCLPLIVLFVSSLSWVLLSPGSVPLSHPRLFYYAVATIASNVVCHLLVAQLCQVIAQSVNALVGAFAAFTVFICALPATGTVYAVEYLLLWIIAVGSTAVHLHYAVNLVYSISDLLGISPFKINVK